MVIKTFNVEEEVYKNFSNHCKEWGLSMSQQINLFMKLQIEEKPKLRKEYEEKLIRIRKEEFVKVKGSLMKKY
jgi:antitoxin component of RelBE/YafQ-DinJ toxin-antitoxin module